MEQTRTADRPGAAISDAEFLVGIGADPVFLATASALLVLDSELRIRAVNSAYLRLTDQHRDELLNRTLLEVYPQRPHRLRPSGVTHVARSLENVVRDGHRHRMGVQRCDIPSGTETDEFVRRAWYVVNSPLHRDGVLVGALHEVWEARPMLRTPGHVLNRRVVNRAVGILMGWHGCPADEALQALRTFAANHDVPLSDVATALLDEGCEPSGLDVLADLDWLLTGISRREP